MRCATRSRRLAGADTSAVLRFEADGTVTAHGNPRRPAPGGRALELDPDYVVAEVHRTGRAARFDTDDPAAPGMPEVVRAERSPLRVREPDRRRGRALGRDHDRLARAPAPGRHGAPARRLHGAGGDRDRQRRRARAGDGARGRAGGAPAGRDAGGAGAPGGGGAGAGRRGSHAAVRRRRYADQPLRARWQRHLPSQRRVRRCGSRWSPCRSRWTDICGARSPRGRWSRATFRPALESRLAEFAELLATAISNLQARDALAGSRARIATAADEERRRVVRDLHDGAQQRLVHTLITLKLARQALDGAGDDVRGLLDEALGQAEQAMGELRELAHGIMPAVLTHGGLRAGIEALASRTPVPVAIDVPVDRMPAAVEATAYFVVAEALTNMAKHASARKRRSSRGWRRTRSTSKCAMTEWEAPARQGMGWSGSPTASPYSTAASSSTARWAPAPALRPRSRWIGRDLAVVQR